MIQQTMHAMLQPHAICMRCYHKMSRPQLILYWTLHTVL